MNWLKIGLNTAPFLASIILSVIIVIVAFRKYIAPDIVESLEEAKKTVTTLASLGGMKKQDWHDVQKIEKAVTTDLIYEKMPELQALRLVLSPSTWEQVEEMIDTNPAAVMQLYEKWKPYLDGAGEAKQDEYMY